VDVITNSIVVMAISLLVSNVALSQEKNGREKPTGRTAPELVAPAHRTLEPIEAIDQAFLDLNPEKALSLTRAALAVQPHSADVLWRHSRALAATADRIKNKDAQLAGYEQAKSFADKAVSLQPKMMGGYLRRAVASGKIALFKGVLETRELVVQTKNDAEAAIKLNNGTPYDLALAHYLLGRVHLKLSETPKVMRMPLQLAWGNIREAEKNLERAVSLSPEAPGFQVDYAAALIKLEKNAQAKAVLTRAVSLKALDVSDVDKIAEGKVLLRSL